MDRKDEPAFKIDKSNVISVPSYNFGTRSLWSILQMEGWEMKNSIKQIKFWLKLHTDNPSCDSSLMDEAPQIISDFIEQNKRYRAALEDFKTHGLRADLNPTQPMGDWEKVSIFFLQYIKQIEESVKCRASEALKESE